MSSRSPTTSERMTDSTWAGAQAAPKRPPFTRDRRLRMQLISWILAPQASSCWLISCNSVRDRGDCSNRAEPPPESKNSTVSSAVRPETSSNARPAARKEASSTMGCPASRISKGSRGPWLCSYLVITAPAVMRVPKTFRAALAICQPALPTEIKMTRPEPKSRPASDSRTATSGSACSMAAE